MYSKRSGLILGFHGCDQRITEDILLGRKSLNASRNKYDWLGHGIYFWDHSLSRAFEYANLLKANPKRSNTPITTPAVIGAVIDLGSCLDLLDYSNLEILNKSYLATVYFRESNGLTIPKNHPVGNSKDLLLRELDCAVIEMLHQIRRQLNLPAIDSVRAVFFEGEPLYENAGFREKNHIQLCIRNPNCIKGYFHPLNTDETYNSV